MSYHYGVPPSHFARFYDSSPNTSDEYVQYAAHHDTTPLRHSRKTSHASPRVGGYYSPVGGSPPYNGDPNVYYAKPRKDVYVSTEKGKASHYGYNYTPSKKPSSRKQSQTVHVYDDEAGYAVPINQYSHHIPEIKPKHKKKPSADTYFYFSQDQIYEEQKPKRTSTRRASTSTKSPRKPSRPQSYTPMKATEDDAERAGIPAGYSIKNWDPSEEPIVLLGSVFDANSLGKWIYDWTVYHHGASTPMADMGGDLWLLLIKLAGKMKRAEESLRKIRNVDSHDMVDDFIHSGHRLSDKFRALLKETEVYMLRAAKRDGSKTMGKNAGTEFVDSIFGRDRYLEQTQSIMVSIRLWCMRFDANCEEILRRPSAA